MTPYARSMDARSVGAMARITIPCPPDQAVRVVQDLKGIEKTELKADRVDVEPASDEHGTYAVTGHFAGAPWRSRFAYRLHAAGFHSHKVDGERPHSWGISGGFVVAPLGTARCMVLHYEDYELPPYLLPLKPAILAYLRWSMRSELARLREIIEGAPHPAG
jgi:polyketide cyclase/dehydrase/lipid transport protein